MFTPRINENGRVCCSNEAYLCPKCKAYHDQQYEPPDPYADGITALRAASAGSNVNGVVTPEERASLGIYADGVAAMRSTS